IAAIVPSLGWCSLLVLAATGATSRAAIVWLMARTPSARSDGLSASTGQPDSETLKWTLVIGLAIAFLLLLWSVGFVDTIFALLAGTAATLAVQRLALRQIGGQTGDVCGAVQVASEIAMLAAVTASLP
ncbi:MAG: adenosylcobinamide-GDP ribazoletransferase, partial [Rhizobiales bacterium]|nr:adenosylcobinamide-GDP ribazoletransferase [Hyphomicrobiales bacterium]